MAGVVEKLLTADEFWEQYAAQDLRYELVEGIPIEMPPPAFDHSATQSYLVARLLGYVEEHSLGRVLVECDFRLSETVVRRPDVAFVARERLPLITDPHRFVPIPPDLAVEVISPSETALLILEKVTDYLRFGVRLVWLVYPQTRQVVIHRPDGSAHTYGPDDALDGGDVLPGLTLPLARIFPPETL